MPFTAATVTFPSDANDPFGVSPVDFEGDLPLNVTGAYTALHRASRGFLALKEEGKDFVPLVFIATGNVTPFQPRRLAVTLGSGKAALAYLIELGEKAYETSGFR